MAKRLEPTLLRDKERPRNYLISIRLTTRWANSSITMRNQVVRLSAKLLTQSRRLAPITDKTRIRAKPHTMAGNQSRCPWSRPAVNWVTFTRKIRVTNLLSRSSHMDMVMGTDTTRPQAELSNIWTTKQHRQARPSLRVSFLFNHHIIFCRDEQKLTSWQSR